MLGRRSIFAVKPAAFYFIRPRVPWTNCATHLTVLNPKPQHKKSMGDEDREAIKLVCVPQKDLADALGVSYSTLRNWSSGRIEIPPENSVALTRFLRAHAKKLVAAADELEG